MGVSKLPVRDVMKRLVSQLNICRKNKYAYKWWNQMINTNLIISHSDLHQLLITDLCATLDLMVVEKDSSIVNNHAVIGVFVFEQIGEKLHLKTAKIQLTK